MASAQSIQTDGAERRGRLRQYQAQLLERMQAARSGVAGASKELGLLLGAQRCLLPLTQAGEIVAPTGISAVPLSHDWYLGLLNIRGNLTGVVDLARYGGAARAAPDSNSRVVTFAPALGFHCALLASRVLGLRDPGAMRAEPPAPGAPAWAPQRFVDADAQVWTRIDLSALVREARFLHVGF
jgi:twitching motility protein PilI